MPNALGNLIVSAIIASPLHPLLGPGTAVITVRGRKSGRAITTPINVVADGASFLATSLRSRKWWRNLRGGARAELRVAGRQQPIVADVIEDHAAVVEGFTRYFSAHPNLARYFSVPLDADRRPNPDRLRRLADERVMIRLDPRSEA